MSSAHWKRSLAATLFLAGGGEVASAQTPAAGICLPGTPAGKPPVDGDACYQAVAGAVPGRTLARD